MAEKAEHTYLLSILTIEKTIFQDQVYSSIFPGISGYFEVLAHHAPLLAILHPGKLVITTHKHEKLIYAVSSGILEVSNNQASLLADAIELASEIDLDRAKLAFEKAYRRLLDKEEAIDQIRAKNALKRAENRIKVYQEAN